MPEPVEEYVARAPTPLLRPFVKRYIGYRLMGFSPGLHRGFPSGTMTFVVTIDQPLEIVVQTNPNQSPGEYHSVVSGLHRSPALIAHDGNQEGIEIELTPLGSRSLFGAPASELWDLSVELTDVVGAPGQELRERLQHDTRWEERFQICDEVLSGMYREVDVVPELAHAWHALVDSRGRLTVSDLARDVGYSRQHLGRLFRNEFGVTPKLASRLIRFAAARRMMQSVPPFVTFAQVAAACGYYDQSHLNRDFIELGGCTPSEFYDDLPFFQDDGSVDGSY